MLTTLQLGAAILSFFAPHTPHVASHIATAFVPAAHHHCSYQHRTNDPFVLPEGEEVWFWSPYERLTWADYEGTPDESLYDVAALTSSGILSWKGCKDGKIDYQVRAYFDKKSSWVKPQAFTTYHLAHEQGHFDITEIYSRRLDIALKERSFDCGEEDEFEDFINEFLEDWQRAERQYDLDSGFSTKPVQQEVWLNKIRSELNRSSIYANTNPFD